MEVLFLIGRIVYSLVFLFNGYSHFTQTNTMAGYAESKGARWGRPAVLISGGLLLLGAALVILGIWVDLGAILIALFLLGTLLVMHDFWRETDPQSRQQEMIQFMKNLGLLGAALILLYAAWELDEGLGLTITDPLFT